MKKSWKGDLSFVVHKLYHLFFYNSKRSVDLGFLQSKHKRLTPYSGQTLGLSMYSTVFYWKFKRKWCGYAEFDGVSVEITAVHTEIDGSGSDFACVFRESDGNFR